MNANSDRYPPFDGNPLRVCFVMLHYAQSTAEIDPLEYLAEVPIHAALPEAVAALGHEVHLVHQFPRDFTFTSKRVHYHFVAERSAVRLASRFAGRLRRRDPALYEPANRCIQRIRSLNADVLHVHGTTLNLNLYLLFRSNARIGSPALLHYHGGYPARSALGKRLQRANFERAARYGFTTAAHAQPFIDAGLLNFPERLFPLIETSSTFHWRDRSEARRETAMVGDPVFLSVGRLHEIKDPLTMLRGFERILKKWPSAQLYLFYTSSECLATMGEFLDSEPELREHVHFRGRATFAEMEAIYNSADFLLQASRREFSGCAILEAMACGVIPVVTDIPSFRAMTESGRFGLLFPIGDADALARQVLAIDSNSIGERSDAIRAHFERALSFRALANQLIPVYRQMLAERRLETSTNPTER